MSGQSEDVIRGLYEAFARGDVPSVLGGFAPDIEWHEAEGMPYGGVYRGPEAIVENVFGPIATDVEGFAIAPEQLIAAGDTVAAVVRYTGTGKATGKPLDLPVVHVWDIRDGKVARFRQFADTVRYADVVPADASVVAA
ncbi:MAG TPA: nuclear transport factor 2 family protein [Solirubrobacteraceae bacterium]|nr:nuclear transport factor 2 family protein [Solirubrobacteraceae bacterium]